MNIRKFLFLSFLIFISSNFISAEVTEAQKELLESLPARSKRIDNVENG
jgi:hypothetical protein